jgi:hypothetical protein
MGFSLDKIEAKQDESIYIKSCNSISLRLWLLGKIKVQHLSYFTLGELSQIASILIMQ